MDRRARPAARDRRPARCRGYAERCRLAPTDLSLGPVHRPRV